MSRVVRVGLIQAANPINDESVPVADIQEAMFQKHLPLIDQAGEAGVQVLGLQEIFNGPYFCPGQDKRWYEAAEAVPGPTTERMAGNGSHSGFRKACETVEDPVTVPHPMPGKFGRRKPRPGIDVRAGTEGALALSRENDRPHRAIAFEFGAVAFERCQHVGRQRVELGRIVEPDLGDRAVDDQMKRAHGAHPIGAFESRLFGIVVAFSATATRPSDASTISAWASIPGMISVATSPFSPSRMTQRSVT